MPVYTRAYAAARFFGPSLDPLIISLALRLPADHVHRDGEPRFTRTRNGKVIEFAPYRGGSWSMSSERWVQSRNLKTHLDWLLKHLEPKAEAVASILRDGVGGDFFCFSAGRTDRPPTIPREIRKRAAALNLEIVIDHYDVSPRLRAE
jgi:hypothetical protein